MRNAHLLVDESGIDPRAPLVSTTYHVRLTDDWLPLPAALLTTLGWREGDQVEIEVVDGTLIITPPRPAETPRRSQTKN
jgi:hypothetical protein